MSMDATPVGRTGPATASTLPNWGPSASAGYGSVAWNKREADEVSQTSSQHIILHYFTPFTNRETSLGGTRVRTETAASGSCAIIPAGADYRARWREDKEVAVFTLSDAWLDRMAQEDLGLSTASVFADALPVVDRRLASMGEMLREELRSSGSTGLQGLELDSMLNLVGVHLLNQYGVARPRKDLGGLSDRQFRTLRDLMRASLTDGVSLDEMARVVGLSSSQLLRSFRKRTGTSPHKYLTRLRLDHARSLIASAPVSLAEIATTCGFSSQSHLTMTMRREDGLTPGALRH